MKSHGMTLALALMVTGGVGCGGAATQTTEGSTAPRARVRSLPRPVMAAEPVAPPERQPLEVNVVAERDGTLLRVDIHAIGRGHSAGEGFETPASWQVDALLAGRPMKVLMRGPVRVEREPVGEVAFDAWDVEVAFSAFFEIPKGAPPAKVKLTVVAPEDTRKHEFERTLPPAIAAR